MAQFAIKQRIPQVVRVHVTTLMLFSGKARYNDKSLENLSKVLDVSVRTVRRASKWLLARNWWGIDTVNKWYFFRGIDRIRKMENWQRTRAAIITQNDLVKFKAWCAASLITSLVKQTNLKQNRKTERDEAFRALSGSVSLQSIRKILGVSISTAYRLRTEASKFNYITLYENTTPIKNMNKGDLKALKRLDIDYIEVEPFGKPTQFVPKNRIKIKEDKPHLMLPPQIITHLQTSRRNVISP